MRSLTAGLILVAVLGLMIGLAPAAVAADPVQDACNALKPPMRDACLAASGNPGAAAGDVVGGAASAASQSAAAQLAKVLADSVATTIFAVEQKVLDNNTTPNLNPNDPKVKAFWDVYRRIGLVAVSLTLLVFLFAVLVGVLKGSGQLLKEAVLGLVKAGLLGPVIIAVTGAGLVFVDQSTLFVIGGDQAGLKTGLDNLAAIFVLPQSAGVPGQMVGALLLGSFFALLGAGLLELELLMRGALIYLVVALLPLVLAAQIWPAFQSMLKKILMVLVGLVMAKLAIGGALAVGLALFSLSATPGQAPRLDDLLMGVGILLVTALSPFAIGAILPLAEAELARAHGSTYKQAGAWAADRSSQMITAAATGGGSSAAAGAAGAKGALGESGKGALEGAQAGATATQASGNRTSGSNSGNAAGESGGPDAGPSLRPGSAGWSSNGASGSGGRNGSGMGEPASSNGSASSSGSPAASNGAKPHGAVGAAPDGSKIATSQSQGKV